MKPEQQLLVGVILSYRYLSSPPSHSCNMIKSKSCSTGVSTSKSDLLLSTQSTCNSSHCGLCGCALILCFHPSWHYSQSSGVPNHRHECESNIMMNSDQFFSYYTELNPCGAGATDHMSLMDLEYSCNFTFLFMSPCPTF